MWVVSKSVCSARLVGNHALKFTARLNQHYPVRGGNAHGAYKARTTLVRRNAAHQSHQLRVVARITVRARTLGASPIRTVYAGRSLERVYFQSAVIRKHCFAKRRGVITSFNTRIFFKR